ncbi:MAG: VOC family protein, partial [Actinomycetota bacterium]
ADVDLRDGTPDECEVRAVREFVSFTDPAGLPGELAVAPSRARGLGFVSDQVPGGFLTGSQGLGHVVGLADDPAETIEFYTQLLGFNVSDTLEEETPDGRIFATFLHCNRRHHTLAIGKRLAHMPADKLFAHFMVQVHNIDAVGLAYDRALDAGLPIFRTLGRHPNDGMFSFYMRTNAGFDIEFGSGALEVGDDWQVVRHGQGSAWGHRRGQGFV